MLEELARLYFTHCPVEKGKWWAWTRLRARLSTDRLPAVERRLPSGMVMRLSPADEVDRFIYFWNQWEPNETWLFGRLLRRGDAVVDVGANIGYFTLLAAALVGPEGRVLAVEPSPPTLESLRANIALNRLTQVRVESAAVSDRDGTVQINQRFAGNSGMNTMRPGHPGGASWSVPTRRLDEIIPADWPVRLVKIDVEGAEALALRGLAGRLSGADAPDVLCEITDGFIETLGGDPREPFRLMTAHGYRAYALIGRSLRLIEREPGPGFQANVLFSKREMAG